MVGLCLLNHLFIFDCEVGISSKITIIILLIPLMLNIIQKVFIKINLDEFVLSFQWWLLVLLTLLEESEFPLVVIAF